MLKLKRSVSQLSLAWKSGTSTCTEDNITVHTDNQDNQIQIIKDARDNLQEASLQSPSTTAANDAQATKISIFSLI